MEAVAITVIATVFNLGVLWYKLEKGMWESFAVDVGVICLMNYMFLGMKDGMMTAMCVSFIMSIILWIRPPQFMKGLLE